MAARWRSWRLCWWRTLALALPARALLDRVRPPAGLVLAAVVLSGGVVRWPLAVPGAWAFILHQRACTRAPLQASLPALSVASPLAGMAFGALAFREAPAGGPLAVPGRCWAWWSSSSPWRCWAG